MSIPKLEGLLAKHNSLLSSVEVSELLVPLETPVQNGSARIAERRYTLVTIETDSGDRGVACALSREAPLAQVLLDFIAPRVLGRSTADLGDSASQIFYEGALFLGRSGAFPRAVSLFDLALWDLAGVGLKQSVSDALGGGFPVPVLMALGYYRDDQDLNGLVRDYTELVERGFRHFKVMAGGASVEEDRERIRAISGALPPDSTLAVDVNGVWSTADEGLYFLERVSVPFSFVEDPFRPDDRDSLAAFRRATTVPVAIGEWESGASSFREMMAGDLLDVARLDATAVGGATEWLKVAAIAREFDKQIVPHYFPELHIQLASVVPHADLIEMVPVRSGAENFGLLLTEPAVIESPVATPSQAPGWGISWDWDAVSKYTASHRVARK